ncbi:unnamed protein product [Owenia fusiformis]|uniref:Uncharacterized protein n=1 Tax=Owenia fusiformis TaxID=6347 RepID=A0A8J1TGV1_OWEFU|nr:unnamed protein product [Owenia fusiformis]
MEYRKHAQWSFMPLLLCICIAIVESTGSVETLNQIAAKLGECPVECDCELRTDHVKRNTTRTLVVVKCSLGETPLDSVLQNVLANTTHLYVNGGHKRVGSITPGSFQRFINLKVLEIVSFEISKLSNDTFYGLASLETLIMKDNMKLVTLEACVFCPLRNLRHLSLWGCPRLSLRISTSDVPKALCGLNKATIETLILHRINKVEYKGSSYFLPRYLQCLHGSNLKSLDLSYNWISLIYAGLSNMLPHLEYITIAQNNIIGDYRAGFDIIKFTKLKRLILSYQNFYWDTFNDGDPNTEGDHPVFREQREKSINTTDLDISKIGRTLDEAIAKGDKVNSDNTVKDFAIDPYCSPFSFPLPKDLVEIKIDNFRPGLEIQRGICFAENSLRKLNVANANIPIFRGPVKGFNQLEELDMRHNLIGVREDIARDAFYFLPSLRVLLLGNNNLGRCLSNDTDGLTFSQLPKLEELDLSSNNIISLPSDMFKSLANLRKLNISGNKIVSFHVNFNHNPWMIVFDLSNNELRSLSAGNRETFDSLFNKHGELFHVDLTDNNFMCSCKSESSEYLKWFKETKPFLKSYDEYECFFSEDDATYRISNLDTNHYRTICDYANILIAKLVAGFVSLGIVIAITTKLIHFYRWRIRYWNFAFKQLWKRYRYKRYIEGHEIKYDAFVSFQNDDLNWIRNELCKNIEDTGDFKLCIHHRDFVVGEFILDNIVNAIQSSRQTIIVVSEKYLNSNYTHFELQMAYSMMIDKGVDIIIAVVLDPIEGLLRHPNMTSTLKRLLMQKTYIQWETHDFWERLKLKLNDKNRSFDI